jgi:hypothetical protein
MDHTPGRNLLREGIADLLVELEHELHACTPAGAALRDEK